MSNNFVPILVSAAFIKGLDDALTKARGRLADFISLTSSKAPGVKEIS